MSANVYEYVVKNIEGKEVQLSEYKNKVLLVVNVASKCGFTNQYSGLENLYKKYQNQGLVILGFPCNQFGAQEPGNEAEIKNFCSLSYQVTFPMFSKVDVNGDNEHKLYSFLKESLPGIMGTKAVKWNFTKFLIGKDGIPVKRYAPQDTPESLENDIIAELKK